MSQTTQYIYRPLDVKQLVVKEGVKLDQLNDSTGVARMLTITDGVLGYQNVPSFTEADPLAILNQGATPQTGQFYISGNGRMGTLQVGTSNNTYPLEVNGDIRMGYSLRTTLNGNRLTLRYDGNPGIGMVFASGNGIQYLELGGNHYIQSIGSNITGRFIISAWTAQDGLEIMTPAGTKTYLSSTGGIQVASLDTSNTAPATVGTTKMVVCDSNGLLSFTDIPTGGPGGGGGGDALLAGGTSGAPQIFTGYNQYTNGISIDAVPSISPFFYTYSNPVQFYTGGWGSNIRGYHQPEAFMEGVAFSRGDTLQPYTIVGNEGTLLKSDLYIGFTNGGLNPVRGAASSTYTPDVAFRRYTDGAIEVSGYAGTGGPAGNLSNLRDLVVRKVFAPGLENNTTGNVVYFNNVTGELSYGTAPVSGVTPGINEVLEVNNTINPGNSLNLKDDANVPIFTLYNDGGTATMELGDGGVNAKTFIYGNGGISTNTLTLTNAGANHSVNITNTNPSGSGFTVTLPGSAGQLALVSQIPTDNSQLANGAGYLTSSPASVTFPYQGSTPSGVASSWKLFANSGGGVSWINGSNRIFTMDFTGITNNRTVTFPDINITVVGTDNTATLTNKRVNPRVNSLTDATTISVNGDTSDMVTVTLAGNRTISSPSGTPVDGQKLTFRIKQDTTGSRTVTWDTAYRFGTDITSTTLTTTASKTDYVGFVYNAADAKWDCVSFIKGF